ncbi:Abhydrolase family protein [compost metagenome]
MNWTTDAFLGRLYALASEQRLQCGPDETKEKVQGRLRGELKRVLGAFPAERQPLGAAVLERIEYDDFIVERVSYSTMEAMQVPVLVLVPKDGPGPWPAVLACHGHGNGQLDAAGLGPDFRELDDPGIHNRFAVQLVRQGLLVVVPEIMGFGERRMAGELKANPHGSSCGMLASQLLMYGRTLAGMRVYEAMRAVDYIESRADVLPARVGAFGFSGGSLIAAFASALDERLGATVLCGWTNTFRGSIMAMHHCRQLYAGNAAASRAAGMDRAYGPEGIIRGIGCSRPDLPGGTCA